MKPLTNYSTNILIKKWEDIDIPPIVQKEITISILCKTVDLPVRFYISKPRCLDEKKYGRKTDLVYTSWDDGHGGIDYEVHRKATKQDRIILDLINQIQNLPIS